MTVAPDGRRVAAVRSLFPAAIAIALAASLPACKSAAPKPRTAEPLPAALQAWVGQKRLLAGAGEAKSLTLRKNDPLPKGDCDLAVEIRRASFDKGTVALSLETLGRVEVPGRSRGNACRQVPGGRQLSVSGLASAEEAPPALERFLTTSEAHLAARHVSFDLLAEAGPPKLAAIAPEASGADEERSLGRQVTAWPKLLLAVHPFYKDPSGRVQHQGLVEFTAIVGADGRVHAPKLVTALTQRHEEHVLKALSLWRYDPAKKRDERVAARVRGSATLRID